jgi:hypothetical protein
LERSCQQFDRRDRDAIDEEHRDYEAEGRHKERIEAAGALIRSMGQAWHGWEFWYVVTEMNLNPAHTAATWSPEEIYEAFFYLRLGYLRNPR